MTIDEYVAGLGLTFAARQGSRPDRLMEDMPAGSRHYLCAIENPATGQGMTVWYSQGPAIAEPPTLAGVLDTLASDAAGFENAASIDDWRMDYGYDEDEPATDRIYAAVEGQTERLRVLLGEDYDRLLWEVQR